MGIEGAHRSELVRRDRPAAWLPVCEAESPGTPGKGRQRGRVQICQGHGGLSLPHGRQEHPEMSGNPVSRMWRKHRLKKQYQKQVREAVKTGAGRRGEKDSRRHGKRPGQRR